MNKPRADCVRSIQHTLLPFITYICRPLVPRASLCSQILLPAILCFLPLFSQLSKGFSRFDGTRDIFRGGRGIVLTRASPRAASNGSIRPLIGRLDAQSRGLGESFADYNDLVVLGHKMAEKSLFDCFVSGVALLTGAYTVYKNFIERQKVSVPTGDRMAIVRGQVCVSVSAFPVAMNEEDSGVC